MAGTGTPPDTERHLTRCNGLADGTDQGGGAVDDGAQVGSVLRMHWTTISAAMDIRLLLNIPSSSHPAAALWFGAAKAA